MTTDLVRREPGQIQEWTEEPEPEYLVPVMDLKTAKRRIDELQEFVAGYLVYGVDYGKIPGAKQPSLLKPGAEKLAEIYGLAPTFPKDRQSSVQDWTKAPPYLKYTITCVLVQKRTQIVAGEGLGTCNSHEVKYKYRWQNNQRVLNTEVADIDNTILKMAKKRALVDAVIEVTGSSGIFTQDLEDQQEQERPKQQRRGRPPAPPPPQPQSAPAPAQPQQASSPAQAQAKMPGLEASLAGFAGCTGAGQVEQYYAREFELARRYGDTHAMAELQKARQKRREEIRRGPQQQGELEQMAMGEHGVEGVFNDK